VIEPRIHEDSPVASRRTLRQFAGLCVAFGAGVGAWPFVAGNEPSIAVYFGVAVAALGVVGLAVPERIRPVYSGLLVLTIPIGRVVSFALLAVLFYGVFTPLGLLFRLFGRDALDRRRRERETYWAAKPMSDDPRSYLRQ
jgi:hypothetical protein